MDASQGLFTKNIYKDHDICLKDRKFIKIQKCIEILQFLLDLSSNDMPPL